jgi:hypothetical protein
MMNQLIMLSKQYFVISRVQNIILNIRLFWYKHLISSLLMIKVLQLNIYKLCLYQLHNELIQNIFTIIVDKNYFIEIVLIKERESCEIQFYFRKQALNIISFYFNVDKYFKQKLNHSLSLHLFIYNLKHSIILISQYISSIQILIKSSKIIKCS